MQSKAIIIDFSIFLNKAVFCYPNNPSIPPTYNALNMIISTLYKLRVDPDDIIIISLDGRHSWRKDFELAYKGNRAETRANSGIDWNKWYGEFNSLIEQLRHKLNWHFIGPLDRIEADDQMAVMCRYYKDREVILVTHDADMYQMWEYPNVKIFSTLSKKQGGGKWKIKPQDWDIHRFQAEKIYKETCDNMVAPILNEQDYEKRRMCVNLLELPEWVENNVILELSKIGPKDCNIEALPFISLRPKLANLYNDYSKVIDYDEQIKKEQGKKDKVIQKKLTEKDKIKKVKDQVEAKYKKQLELTEKKYQSKIAKLQIQKEKENVNKNAQNTNSAELYTA